MNQSKTIVISLGGSVIAPKEGINLPFLKEFNQFIREKVRSGLKFMIVCGGGWTSRAYMAAAREFGSIEKEDIDWIGIYATRLNAQLLRFILQDKAWEKVITDPVAITGVENPVIVGAGWKPGCSTDYDAVLAAEKLNAEILINMSDISQVYDIDPNKFPQAKPLSKISWQDYLKIVGTTWDPGLNTPFDPVASQLAWKIGLKVVVLAGTDLVNLNNFLEGKEFLGTAIG